LLGQVGRRYQIGVEVFDGIDTTNRPNPESPFPLLAPREFTPWRSSIGILPAPTSPAYFYSSHLRRFNHLHRLCYSTIYRMHKPHQYFEHLRPRTRVRGGRVIWIYGGMAGPEKATKKFPSTYTSLSSSPKASYSSH